MAKRFAAYDNMINSFNTQSQVIQNLINAQLKEK